MVLCNGTGACSTKLQTLSLAAAQLARRTSLVRARRSGDPAARAILADAAARRAQQGAELPDAVTDTLNLAGGFAAPGSDSSTEPAGDAAGSGGLGEGSAGPGALRRSRARVVLVAERALPALEGLATVIKVRAHTTSSCQQMQNLPSVDATPAITKL